MDVTYPKNLDAFYASRPVSFEDTLKLIKQYGSMLYLFERLGQSDMVKAVEDVLYHLRYCYYFYQTSKDIEGLYFITAYERQFPALKLSNTIPTEDFDEIVIPVEAPVSQVPQHDRQVISDDLAPPISLVCEPETISVCDSESFTSCEDDSQPFLSCEDGLSSSDDNSSSELVVSCDNSPHSWIPTFDVVLQVRRAVSRRIRSYFQWTQSFESVHQTPEYPVVSQCDEPDLCAVTIVDPVPTALCVREDILCVPTNSDVVNLCAYSDYIHLREHYEVKRQNIDWSVWGELPYLDPFIEHGLPLMKCARVPDDCDHRVMVLFQTCVRGRVLRGRDFLLYERDKLLIDNGESLRRRCLPALARDLVQLAGGWRITPTVC